MPVQQVRDVRFLSLDSPSYLEHQRHHTVEVTRNSGSKTPDPKLLLTSWLEEKVRNEIANLWQLTQYRVLRWDEYNVTRGYVTRFQELDGVYENMDGVPIVLEVKGSIAESGLKKAIIKLKKTMLIVSRRDPRSVGLIVAGDLGSRFAGFGTSSPEVLTAICGSKAAQQIEWPIKLPSDALDKIFICFLTDDILGSWIEECPSAYRDESDRWHIADLY